ncbi:MAG: ATP-dependent helicase HrpB [Desulfobacteraceae bacterium]|nr:MAG: ATP-dependent helicase HrpB [Desulfobacteraceae bacterium]
MVARLPIAPVLGELEAALAGSRNAVLIAPPGAGKTTAVPPALLHARWMSGKRILLLAPRRLAARAAAYRMAALLNERAGETVGYRIRMESRVGPLTRVEVITEGVLTRILQSDPALTGVGIVIFDEFHERSLDADLGLALCREIQSALNESLRLLVMSATLDPAPVTNLLGNAPLIQCDGRSFPVETRYVSFPHTKPVERAVADIILRSAAAEEGNILAFLPGAPEIRRVFHMLDQSRLGSRWDVAPLYGNLTREQQDCAIAPPPAGRSKIVLATSIAETSLTIEQIRVVVDSGFQRAPRFDPRTGMTRLVTLPVSQASADQRRGRAGRVEPGICYRLWSEAVHAALPARNRPEILDTDLSGLALDLAIWGAPVPDDLGWLDPPPSGAYEQARELLMKLEALDCHGKITAHGRSMAELPVHPRLAHMLLAARDEGMGRAACEVAAVLSERDPLHFEPGMRDADLRLRLDILNCFKVHKPMTIPSGSVDEAAVRQIRKVASLLEERIGFKDPQDSPPEPGRLAAWAYPDRIACRRPEKDGHYLMTNGRGAFFEQPDALRSRDFLVIPELDGERRNARIYLAAAYDRETLMAQFSGEVKWKEEVYWDDQRKAVAALRRLTLGALTIKSEPLADPEPGAVAAAMIEGIRRNGIAVLPWTRNLRTWQARVMLLRRLGAGNEDWPDISDNALGTDLEAWLGPWLEGITSLKALSKVDLHAPLRSLLPWQQQQLVEKLAPTHIVVPSGARRPIDYSGDTPILAVRLQEMFGAIDTPSIAEGRLPLLLHLLSPAGRPAQITQDLAGFWRNSYPFVKKELKGRYPKHYWPDDPVRAKPR